MKITKAKCPKCKHEYIKRKEKEINRCPRCQHNFIDNEEAIDI